VPLEKRGKESKLQSGKGRMDNWARGGNSGRCSKPPSLEACYGKGRAKGKQPVEIGTRERDQEEGRKQGEVTKTGGTGEAQG